MPSRQTMMNIQRKMRSITMATYFQSSFTWEGERDCECGKRIQLPLYEDLWG